MGGIWMAVVKVLIWGSLIWWLLHVHALTASSLHQQTQIRRQTQLQMQYYTIQLALRDKTWHKHHNTHRRYAALKKRLLFLTELRCILSLLTIGSVKKKKKRND